MENRMQNVKLVKPVVVGTYAFLLSQQEKRKFGNMTHKWTCLLRCPNYSDLSLFIQKVVFELDPSFIYPKRVYTQPPYEVNEIGWGEFYLTVKIYFADVSVSPVSIVHFVKLNTDTESTCPPCVVNEVSSTGKDTGCRAVSRVAFPRRHLFLRSRCLLKRRLLHRCPPQTYEEIIFRNPTVNLYNKIIQSNNTKTAPHKFHEHFLKYDFQEETYTRKYLQFQSKVQEEICDLMTEATELSKDINEAQQKYFTLKAEMGVSSDDN
ncbi:gas41 homologue, putative [Plasmodium knowlesi strain H]|uniref:Gas41 homologue, putative n=1 Tax=Plasmodium knowlesi (strain H) TaxID=5851 RepID=A0A1A7W1B3_PLAKH|nr:gas41 homologue, putative [Plasmodium knowlesi strain H]SBO27692.1 gas41 homologue, putative [Plasmodium knowlesi strain H]